MMQKLLVFTMMVVDMGVCCVCVCVKEERNCGSGHVGFTLTEVAGTHLLHEAVGTVLHLTLGTDLGH